MTADIGERSNTQEEQKMKYEVMTYTCSKCDYYVVYVLPGIRRVAVLMSIDLEEVRVFLHNQRDAQEIIFSEYDNQGVIIAPSICEECD